MHWYVKLITSVTMHDPVLLLHVPVTVYFSIFQFLVGFKTHLWVWNKKNLIY